MVFHTNMYVPDPAASNRARRNLRMLFTFLVSPQSKQNRAVEEFVLVQDCAGEKEPNASQSECLIVEFEENAASPNDSFHGPETPRA